MEDLVTLKDGWEKNKHKGWMGTTVAGVFMEIREDASGASLGAQW